MSGKRTYPPDWKAISRRVRERSGGRCECEGWCGLHRPRCTTHGEPIDIKISVLTWAHTHRLDTSNPHEIATMDYCPLCPGATSRYKDTRCKERNGQPATWAKGKVVLTVAHLCQLSECADESHMRALCQRCHLRYDRDQHQANARKTRRRKKGNTEMFQEVE